MTRTTGLAAVFVFLTSTMAFAEGETVPPGSTTVRTPYVATAPTTPVTSVVTHSSRSDRRTVVIAVGLLAVIAVVALAL
jgi:hypothetical protein